jgi:uncharacterized protein (TIGR02231 family)
MRRAPADPASPPAQQAQLAALRADLAAERGLIEAIDAEKRAVHEFAKVAVEAGAREARGLDLAAARAAWEAVGAATAQANTRRQEAARKADSLEAQIRALEAALGRPRPGLAPLLDLAIAVDAERAMAATISVTYRVQGARWTPLYDAELDTSAAGPAASLTLVRRANITQTTGEDWPDASLTLSTQRVIGAHAAPPVTPWTLALRDPAMALEASPARGATRAVPMAREPAPMAAPLALPALGDGVAAIEQEAVAQGGDFATRFAVPGRVSVSGDGAQRAVRLGAHRLEAALTARIAPALDPRAFLTASAAWTDAVPLLPGEASLLRDGVFIGKARLGFVAAGDRAEFGFGVDERIKVERAPVRRRDNDPSGWSATRVQTADFRTLVTNQHRRPMRIIVVDRLPVSENSAVTVEPLPSNTAPSERPAPDQRGILTWSHDYAPGEAREFRLGWRLRWPADRELVSQ